MSHTLIAARPGDGKTRAAKRLAQAAVERGESVIVITTSFHHGEWDGVAGVTVTSDETVLERIAVREKSAPLMVVVDDIEKTVSPEAQRVLECIVRLGGVITVSTVLTTSRADSLPAGIVTLTEHVAA